MARIRVNTEDLKNKAKDFESAAEAFARAGDDIAAAAMAMPSYDGQLSGPARKAGYEIQSQAREMKTALTNDALYLQNAAKDFERVNDQAVDALNQNQEMLMAAGSPGGFDPIYSVGTSYIGYNWDPNNPDVMIICMYGVCEKIIKTEQNKIAFENIRKDIDAYYEHKRACEDAWKDSLEYSTLLTAAIAAAITTPGLGILGVIYLRPKYNQATKDYIDNAQLMVDDTHKVANDWNLLTGENIDGYQGDPNYYPYPWPYTSKPGEDVDVYEPPI
jgi:hypothetical protein